MTIHGKADHELNDAEQQIYARLAQNGDEAALRALVQHFRPMVWGLASSRFLPGADLDDLAQEGMVGLWHAVRDFDPAMGPFGPFARLCVNRQMYAAITKANRKRHHALQTATVLEDWMDVPDEAIDPAVIQDSAVSVELLGAHIRATLSELEQEVLAMYTTGQSYDDIAEALQVRAKRIDNALQRARRKIQAYRETELVGAA